jgi:LSD1 subclass zinc finger protein
MHGKAGFAVRHDTMHGKGAFAVRCILCLAQNIIFI